MVYIVLILSTSFPVIVDIFPHSIRPLHAEICNHDNNVLTLSPSEGAKILINGHPITNNVTLHHDDRSLITAHTF